MIKEFYLTHRWDPNSLDQSGPGSNGNERVLHIPQSFRTGALPSDGLVQNPEYLLWEKWVLPLCRDTVGVFYSSSPLDCYDNED